MQHICDRCQTPWLDQNAPTVCGECGASLTTSSLLAVTAADADQSSDGNRLAAIRPPAQSAIGGASPLVPVEAMTRSEQQKSPALAGLLSFLLVGMGQIYLGQVEKGLCLLGVVLLLILGGVPGQVAIAVLLLNVVDAFLLAQRIKEGRPITRWQFFFQSK